MTTKKVTQKESSEDFLGLITFGSLITNVFQIASKKKLENHHENLKAKAAGLKQHYDNMIERYKQVTSAYQSMRNVNTALSKEIQTLNDIIAGLRKENNRLIKELDSIKEENLKLQTSKAEGTVRRKRRLVKGGINA